MEKIEEAKVKVEETKQSWRSIAEEHVTNHVSLKNYAKKHGWKIEHRISKKVSKDVNPKPAHESILGKIAIRKIEEVKEELGKNYSPVDEPLIVMYAKSYERYISLEKEMGMDIEGIIATSTKTGSKYLSPIFTATLSIQKNLVTIANQLGLSIASRRKLGLVFEKPGQKQDSLFDIVANLNLDDKDLDDL